MRLQQAPLFIYQTEGEATLARIGCKGMEHRRRSHHGCRNSRRTWVVTTELMGDTVMIALSDLERIYGKWNL
jgi:hypothetical protein